MSAALFESNPPAEHGKLFMPDQQLSQIRRQRVFWWIVSLMAAAIFLSLMGTAFGIC
ncbi:MAG: hypothetical protein AAF989_07375 [Planctomycetota bacterium]